jgi:hypothetical protein
MMQLAVVVMICMLVNTSILAQMTQTILNLTMSSIFKCCINFLNISNEKTNRKPDDLTLLVTTFYDKIKADEEIVFFL